MKSNLLTSFAVFFTALLSISSVNAQSIVAINPPTVIEGTVEDALLTANFDVTNVSESLIYAYAKRVETSVVPGTANYFCWIQCYSPSVDTSTTPLPIAAGDTVSNFYADYQPYGIAGSTFIDYCFYNSNNADDITCVTIEYRVTGSSAVNEAETVKIGNAQPNPAVDRTMIPFDLRENNHNAHLVVYNILGSEIKSVPVSGTSGTIDLSVSDLQSGVYIYSFFNGNKLLSSSRLVVR